MPRVTDNGKRLKCSKWKMNLTIGRHGNICLLNRLSGGHRKDGFHGRRNWKQETLGEATAGIQGRGGEGLI